MNGNKFKGNQVKKTYRKRKDEYVYDFDEKNDKFGIVTSIAGGTHLIADILDENNNKKQVRAKIMGKHHKKVIFKKEDLIVINCDGNIFEVRGRVNDDDISKIKKQFIKEEETSENTGFTFENETIDFDKI